MMIKAVPDKTRIPELKPDSSAIPKTEPGIIYGNMVNVSRMFVSKEGLRAVRYEIKIPSTTTIPIAHMPKAYVLKIEILSFENNVYGFQERCKDNRQLRKHGNKRHSVYKQIRKKLLASFSINRLHGF